MKKYTFLAVIAAIAVSGCAHEDYMHRDHGHNHDKSLKGSHGLHGNHYHDARDYYPFPNEKNCTPGEYAHGWC